ncbi:hypothetical protein [Roseococcus sp. YIM B11640]|uniref:hypothetical protein n=1 Tax=Roseococcus sp. YIM B11640 TaxID=3133973 RepID=UPI003C7B6091
MVEGTRRRLEQFVRELSLRLERQRRALRELSRDLSPASIAALQLHLDATANELRAAEALLEAARKAEDQDPSPGD